MDDDLYPELTKNKWYWHTGYAIRKYRDGKRFQIVRMHRRVFELHGIPIAIDQVVDHINGDKLDNRFSNLRLVSTQENNVNVTKTWDSQSQYKGVYRSDNPDVPWIAQIGYGRKKVHLGRFKTEEEAANMYNLAAVHLYGKNAVLNKLGDEGDDTTTKGGGTG